MGALLGGPTNPLSEDLSGKLFVAHVPFEQVVYG